MKTLPYQKGNLFTQAVWFLNDYVDILNTTVGEEAKTLIGDARETARRLLELNGCWEKKRMAGAAKNAAIIIKGMLDEWDLPGVVYYYPERKRFRLTGEGYKAAPGEICVGCYKPCVSTEELHEDFRTVEQEGAITK